MNALNLQSHYRPANDANSHLQSPDRGYAMIMMFLGVVLFGAMLHLSFSEGMADDGTANLGSNGPSFYQSYGDAG